MYLSELRQIYVYCTSKELRAMADAMEKRWSEVRPGESTTVASVFAPDNVLVVHIAIDQDRMPARAPRKEATSCRL